MHKKIVLIEDNPEMRDNIQEILELADYDVSAAENGKIGVELVKSVKPDLILCDIMMPELDGYGVLHMISRNPDTSTIPFIFLTAKSEKEDFRKGMNMGADDYLTKPFDDVQLLNAVEKRLARIEQLSTEFVRTENGLNDFFSNLTGIQSLENLKDGKRIKKFAKKDNIYFEGDYPSFLYFVNSGKVKTGKMNEDGKDFVTGLHKEGDFIGYMALIRETPYEESAVALEDCELSLIPREEFLQLLYSSKEVSNKFIKMLAGSVTEKQEELLNLAYDSVRKRVADALIKLSETYKKDSNDQFSMSISRDDLAAIVGTATESVIRTLSEFKSDGYISIKGSNITILDEEELKNFRF
ncbi:MAG: response regulator [Crocinitomicaceae bacterium]|nr:response regulator [Crocinitomicaceae bacterium]